MRQLALVLAAAGSLVLPGSSGAATYVIWAGDRVVLTGTEITCAIVGKPGGKPTATCFLVHKGFSVVGSYSVLITDQIVASTRFTTGSGTSFQVFGRAQPKLPGPLIDTSTGRSGRTIRLALGDTAEISNSHLLLAANRALKGSPTIGIVPVDRQLSPPANAYAAAISAREVVVAQVTTSGRSRVVVRRSHGK